MPQNIYILYLIHTNKKLEKGLAYLSSIVDSMFIDYPNLQIHNIIIDTASTETYNTDDKLIIPGNNACNEFSGWDDGVRYLNEHFNPHPDDIVLFANDSFYTSYGEKYLSLFSKEALKTTLHKKDWAIGYMDDFPKEAHINYKPYKGWIRSNFFLMPHHILIKIGKLTLPLDEDEVFGTEYNSNFWSDTPRISENFKAYISSWLFGIVDPLHKEYQLNWDRCQPLTEDNYSFFKKKALCILSEHYLSAQLNDNGVEITNLNPNKDLEDRHILPYYENQL